MRLLRSIARFASALPLAASCSAWAQQPVNGSEVAAWVLPATAGGSAPTSAFRVLRSGVAVPYTAAGLQRCDKVELTDPNALVLVRLANGKTVILAKSAQGRTDMVVPCDERGILQSTLLAFGALFTPASSNTGVVASLATRSGPDGTVPLAVPLLKAKVSSLVAGERALHLRWTGGSGPFELQLVDKSTAQIVARQAGIAGHEATLPSVALKPGAYRLELRQPDGPQGRGVAEDPLQVVPADTLPPVPAALLGPDLSAEAREVLYADYLADIDQGQWLLEAAQRMAALAPKSEAARTWLLLRNGLLR